MVRALLILGGGCVAVLLLGAVLLILPTAKRHEAVPNGATDVRVEGWRQFKSVACQRVSYHMQPDWLLVDQYAFLQAYGLRRDAAIDQALGRSQPAWQSSTFAIFVRRSWHGLVSERATVALAPTGHLRLRVYVERCVKTTLWPD